MGMRQRKLSRVLDLHKQGGKSNDFDSDRGIFDVSAIRCQTEWTNKSMRMRCARSLIGAVIGRGVCGVLCAGMEFSEWIWRRESVYFGTCDGGIIWTASAIRRCVASLRIQKKTTDFKGPHMGAFAAIGGCYFIAACLAVTAAQMRRLTALGLAIVSAEAFRVAVASFLLRKTVVGIILQSTRINEGATFLCWQQSLCLCCICAGKRHWRKIAASGLFCIIGSGDWKIRRLSGDWRMVCQMCELFMWQQWY